VKVWLRTARRAQIALGATLIVGFLIWPGMRDAFVDSVVPSSRGTFGIGRRRRGKAARPLRSALNYLFWIGGLGTAGSLLILHAPLVLARRREGQGEDEPPRGALPGAGSAGGSAADAPTAWGTIDGPGAAASATEATIFATDPEASGPIAPPPAALADPLSHRPGGRYELRSELGRGGMGIVYEAFDPMLDRLVAIKELPPSLKSHPDLAARFRNEARVLARLQHPGIVQIFDLVEDGRGMWMTMELVTGGSMDALLEDEGTLSAAEVCRLGAAMAEAMAYAHEQGVVHRDFKPHNVLITEDGNPKVMDFGLAKLSAGPQLTQEGAVLGSPAYMSPEQASGKEADARSDIYSFGATLFHMIVGRPPFEGDTASVLIQQITQAPSSASDALGGPLPEALDELLLRTLEKEPAHRPVDMSAIARALERISEALQAKGP